MKCLTICQPFAEAIMVYGKRIENRTWPTSYRGPLLIHAGLGSGWWNLWVAHPERHCLMPGLRKFAELPRGVIVGVCRVVGCRRPADGDGPWASGPWCWMLEDVQPITPAIEWSGMMGLFDVPDEILPKEIL